MCKDDILCLLKEERPMTTSESISNLLSISTTDAPALHVKQTSCYKISQQKDAD